MSKETMFYKLCEIMANMEDCINSFEKIGMHLEPNGSVGYNIYHVASISYNIANTLLEFPDITEEHKIFNLLLQANTKNVDTIAKEVWEKYGIK